MDLHEVIKMTLFNGSFFCRTDMAIRVMAVEFFCRYHIIHPLWWRMQYVKLWHNWGASNTHWRKRLEDITIQKRRLSNLIVLFEAKKEIDPITIGSNSALLDGAHRLSCYIYFNVKDVAVKLINEVGVRPNQVDPFIRMLYTDEEWKQIEFYKLELVNKIEKGVFK